MPTTNIDIRQKVGQVQDGVLGTAHNVWLAGLGAVALAEEEGRGLFDQLVDRGKGLESRGRREVDRARDEVGRARQRVTRRVDELGEGLDRRIAEVMQRMGIPTREEIGALTRRIEDLTERISANAVPAPTTAGTEGKLYRVTWSDEQWKVIADGAERASSVHATKDEAVTAARQLGQAQAPSRVVVERMDGSVQNESTYETPTT